jgi:hypothetical protein
MRAAHLPARRKRIDAFGESNSLKPNDEIGETRPTCDKVGGEFSRFVSVRLARSRHLRRSRSALRRRFAFHGANHSRRIIAKLAALSSTDITNVARGSEYIAHAAYLNTRLLKYLAHFAGHSVKSGRLARRRVTLRSQGDHACPAVSKRAECSITARE